MTEPKNPVKKPGPPTPQAPPGPDHIVSGVHLNPPPPDPITVLQGQVADLQKQVAALQQHSHVLPEPLGVLSLAEIKAYILGQQGAFDLDGNNLAVYYNTDIEEQPERFVGGPVPLP